MRAVQISGFYLYHSAPSCAAEGRARAPRVPFDGEAYAGWSI